MDRHDPLRCVIDHVEVGAAGGDRGGPVIPDGTVDIVWEPGRQPWLAGPDTGPHASSITQPTEMVRVQFRRGRAMGALPMGLQELVDTRQPLADLVPDRRWARIADLERGTDAAPAILDVIRDAMPDAWEPDREVEAVLAGEPTTLSSRQLRRRFRAAVGFGPTTLNRIDRFGRFQREVGQSTSLADAAARAGYADQAHLSRECRRLTGLTPTAFLGA